MAVRYVIGAAAAVVSLAACASTIAGHGSGAGVAPASTSATPSAGLPTTGGAAASASASASARGGSASASASASAGSGAHPVPSRPLRTVTAHATDGTTYVVQVWADEASRNCPAHAYGQVVQFLKRHPCFSMRSTLATTTVDGRPVGFAQRAIGFRGTEGASYRAAGEFRKLVSQSGTGNLNDLMREGYRLPSGPTSVPFPNAFSALGQDNGVTVTEAWYLKGATPDNDPALVKMEHDIFLQV
jgi:hypothetical protein